jgi:hypothetical protein
VKSKAWAVGGADTLTCTSNFKFAVASCYPINGGPNSLRLRSLPDLLHSDRIPSGYLRGIYFAASCIRDAASML